MANDILVLAQSEPLSQMLVSRLRERGRPVFATASAEDALQILRDCPIDIALIESIFLSQDSTIRTKLLGVRPECQQIVLDSFERAKTSGHLLEFGSSDYILRGSDLTRLLELASANGIDRDHGQQRNYAPALMGALDVLVGLQEADSRHFAGFTKQVTRLACAVAEKMDFPPEAREEIAIASLLRDIGKVGVKPEILSEQDKFSQEEHEHMQTHVLWSIRLLEHIKFPGKVPAIIRHHHERYDGTGYPDGLKGRQIPVGGRIIAASESLIAMTSDRPHRPARSQDEAIDELMSGAGTQFDPEVVEAVLRVLRGGDGFFLRGSSLILVVEPDLEFRRLVRMRLLNDGHEVVVTDGVPGVVQSLVARTPDLVLFSSTSGVEEAFRYRDGLRIGQGDNHVPLALIVSEDNRDLRLLALRNGVDDLILKSDDLEEISARVANILTREAGRHRVVDMRPIGVRGHLGSLSLPDIIQMLCMGQKTASVTLNSPSETAGVWFLEGAIIHAECGAARGEKAFYELMHWQEAEFLIQHGTKPGERSIEADPMFLLMEHFRRVDEGGAGHSKVPPLVTSPSVAPSSARR